MKFNKNEFGWKEKVSVNTNLNNDTFNIKFLPDMNISSKVYVANIVDLEENTTYRVNMNLNKKSLSIRYYFSDGTFKSLYSLASKYLLGKVEIYIYRKTDTLIEFDVDNDKYIRYTCNIDEVNKTVEITKKALILGTDNKQEYTPTSDYHPATKKYVDSKFYMYENIETIYTIPMSEMQKCNNDTGRYVSNIDFDELFINHEEYLYYANYKDDTLIPVTYDSTYNRFITDVLDEVDNISIILGFDLGTHKMYLFNDGMAGVKAYQFTNDLVIKRVPILNVNEVATKKYVDDNDIKMLEYVYNGEVLKITLTDEQFENFGNLQSGEYIVLDSVSPEDIYKCTDKCSIWYGCIFINNILFKVDSTGDLQIGTINSHNAIKIYTESNFYNSSTQAITFRNNFSLAVLNNTEQVVLVKCNDVEYYYASKDYVNNAISNILSFNDSGELVVTINGVSKTFVPKQ